MRYIMSIVENGVEETAGLLGITLNEYRSFLGLRCSEFNMSDCAIENGGLEGYCEQEELNEFNRISSLIEDRYLLARVNQDVEFQTRDSNNQIVRSEVYSSCPLRY